MPTRQSPQSYWDLWCLPFLSLRSKPPAILLDHNCKLLLGQRLGAWSALLLIVCAVRQTVSRSSGPSTSTTLISAKPEARGFGQAESRGRNPDAMVDSPSR